MLHSMHTDSPIIKEAEERTAKILDANYFMIDINEMFRKLDIDTSSKRKIKETLKKFPILLVKVWVN